jgi:hypothetical protein
MFAGHTGVVVRIRQAGKAACTNMKARMPPTASGCFSATGPETNPIRARALIASTQKVAPGIGLLVETLIARSGRLS